ncbi:MAG: phosphoribosylglycinamide formyltransferase [Vicingaceae bacterium]
MSVINLAILASGSGTNAEAIIKHFSGHKKIRIAVVLTNNEKAGVIERANRLHRPCKVFNKIQMAEGSLIDIMVEYSIDFVILAGFLLKIPQYLINAYPERIVNIHPALLPKYGGKGMYGHHVHEAVIASGDKESGITIHLVNEQYDKGKILFQTSCPVLPNDDVDTLASRIHKLEHEHYPKIVEKWVYYTLKA